MTTSVKWGRSHDEGFVDSKCGRFHIYPEPMGTTRAQGYALVDDKTGTRLSFDKQSHCKSHADKIIKGEV